MTNEGFTFFLSPGSPLKHRTNTNLKRVTCEARSKAGVANIFIGSKLQAVYDIYRDTKTLDGQTASLEGFSFLTSGIYPFKLRDDFRTVEISIPQI